MLRRLYEVPVGEVRVVRRCPKSPITKQLADYREAISRFSSVSRWTSAGSTLALSDFFR